MRYINYFVLGALSCGAIFGLPELAKAADCSTVTTRFASSSNTLYITGNGTCTLTEIKALRPNAPLDLVDPVNKIWLLRTNLKLEQWARLDVHGSSIGGDVNELRLQSLSSGTNPIVWMRADWGSFHFDHTKVTSWNTPSNAPDTDPSNGRSFIHVRSLLEADGITARESRMDILSSEMAYLGYYNAESYGLVWKVSGTSPGLYDKVNVLGDILDSNIHHNYFGVYTYGAFGMQIKNNEIHDNVSYGLDPHDDSDFLTIENNNSHHNGNHGIICSQRCNNLVIRNNQSHHNVGHGIMLHRNTNQTLVENNQAFNNTDTGIVIFDSHDNLLKNNQSYGNKTGIRLSVGSSNNRFENNDSHDNSLYGIYFYKGSDAPTAGNGRPKNNTFTNNQISSNTSYAIYAKETDENLFAGNQFLNNSKGFYFQDSNNNRLVGNFINNPNVASFEVKRSPSFFIEDFDQAFMIKSLDSKAIVTLKDSRGLSWLNLKNLAATVNSDNAELILTKSKVGSNLLFTPITMRVEPDSNSLTIQPVTWPVSPNQLKSWKERAAVAGINVNHTFHQLTPNRQYQITGLESVQHFTTDGNGDGQIMLRLDTTAERLLSVSPTP